MAVVFTSTGKNNGTAIAIAPMAFSPIVAIPVETIPNLKELREFYKNNIWSKVKKVLQEEGKLLIKK